jgi:hypothetical protein
MGALRNIIAVDSVAADHWVTDGVAQRCFGQLNIRLSTAKELSENLNFIEECLQEGFIGLALEITEEQNIVFKDSPSLLVKIMLRELTDCLRSPNKNSRQAMALNTLKMLILNRYATLN